MTTGNNSSLHYPLPPFVEQPQQAPGLASEMKPLPDHGETSYIGSGKLAGKKALITAVIQVLAALSLSPMRVKARMSPSATCRKKSRTRLPLSR